MRPNHWNSITVEDACEQVSVGIVIQPAQYYTDEANGVKTFRSANVGNGRINDRDWVYISQEGHNKNKKSELKSGDVLVVRSGAPGTSCVVTEEFVGSNCIDIVFARPRKNILLPEFLSIYTNSDVGKKHIAATQGGLALKHFNVGAYKKMTIDIPDIKEQIAIADLLSTWDEAIDKMERLIAAKEKQYEWLVNQHILSPAKNDMRWKHRRICDISERIQRKSDGGDYPILTISSASGFVLQEEKYSRFMAGKSLDDYTLLRRGEFAYNKGNSLRFQFGCIFPLQSYEQALVPHVYVSFRLKTGIDADYLQHLFQADYLKPQLAALVNTGVRNNGLLNISPATFMKVTVPLPPLEQQQQIAAILSIARQEISLLKQQTDALRRQKRGLMQKLLTGVWGVNATMRNHK